MAGTTERAAAALSPLPVVGALFRSKSNSSTKRKLMVFLAPRILCSAEQADYYTQRKYQQLEQQLPRQAQFLKDSLGQLGAIPSDAAASRTAGDKRGWSLKLSDALPVPPTVEPHRVELPATTP